MDHNFAHCTNKAILNGHFKNIVQEFKDYHIIEEFHPIAMALPAALKQEAQRITGEVLSVLTKE